MTLALSVPSGFIPLPVTGDSEQRHADASLIASLAGFTSGHVSEAILGLSEKLHESGVFFAGQLVIPELEPEHYACFTIARTSLGHRRLDVEDSEESASEMAQAIGSSLMKSNPAAVVQYRDLPCGPTVLVLRSGRIAAPDAASGVRKEVAAPDPITTDTLQALIPSLVCQEILVASVGSSSREHWPTFLKYALQMISSIRWDPQSTESESPESAGSR
ncbi:hypothetical protein [Rhodococcus rhodnii]|uniref:Uncharacterized protein n=1 Tax=Rhodococcus rhodnii LMG 5362 TaxID=1273125 RepID=R7WLV5_9NOCA|nr:hypothetical protein [Rhodococcus rhodnii]EOM76278.1 hypothetical protein Rrhod_2378 [Rhodococcus rhodnii LMG 5362]